MLRNWASLISAIFGIIVVLLSSRGSSFAACPNCWTNESMSQGGSQTGVLKKEYMKIYNLHSSQYSRLEFTVWQRDDNIHVNGWKTCVTDFASVLSDMVYQPGTAHTILRNHGGIPPTSNPDDITHAVRSYCSQGAVGFLGSVRIRACLYLTHGDAIRHADVVWKKSKRDDSTSVSAIPDFGWEIDAPMPVESEGYLHRVTITNDDTTDVLIVTDPEFHYSMMEIDLDSVVFSIFPSDFADTLPPQTSWTYDIITDSSLVGGHIYGEFGACNPGDGSPAVVVRFDHPVDSMPSGAIPTLSEWGMIIFIVLLAGWMTFVVVRRWKASQATAA